MIEDGAGQYACKFCGRDSREVRRLVAGAAVSICDQCVAFAVEQIAQQDKAEGLVGFSERDLRLSTQRLECLRIASMRTPGPERTDLVIESARTLMLYVTGDDRLALPPPEMRVVS